MPTPIRVRVRVNGVSPARDDSQNQTGEIVILGSAHTEKIEDFGKLIIGEEYIAELTPIAPVTA